MIVSGPNTYDFPAENFDRSVDRVFQLMVASRPTLFARSLGYSLVGLSPQMVLDGYFGDLPTEGVTSVKHEWINDNIAPISSTLTADSGLANTTIAVADTTGFLPGQVLRFESSGGSYKSVQVYVTAVSTSSGPGNLTVTRTYGGTTDVALVTGDRVIMISAPRQQYVAPGVIVDHATTMDYNYTQIFSQTYGLSGTDMRVRTYSGENKIAYQRSRALEALLYQAEQSMVSGVRVQGSNSIPASAGGLIYFLQAGSNSINVGTQISQTVINNALQLLYEKGGGMGDTTLIGNAPVLRAITGLNTQGSNPVINKIDSPNQRLGNTVTAYVGDLPVIDQSGVQGGLTASMFLCSAMPSNMLIIADMNLVKPKFLTTPFISSPVDGAYGFKEMITFEATYEIKQASAAHVILNNITF